jgi:DNA-binding transcriptional ArsR family regulator
LSSAAGGQAKSNPRRLAPQGPHERSLAESTDPAQASATRSWTFITNHAQVLLYLSGHRHARVSEVAAAAQITERAAYRILRELEEAGYIIRSRRGRRNLYRVDTDLPLADPVVEDRCVTDLLAMLPEADTQAHVRW